MITYGTIGELVKLSSLIRHLKAHGTEFVTANLNQHGFSGTHEALGLPKPDYQVGVSLRELTSSRLRLLPGLLKWRSEAMRLLAAAMGMHERSVVVVHGNTLSATTAMDAYRKRRRLNDRLVHVEAGVRAIYPRKPDINNWRRAALADRMYRKGDRLADLNLAVMKSSVKNLRKEGIGNVVYAQDPMVEIVRDALARKSTMRIPKERYVLVNVTRSVDSRKKAREMLRVMERSRFRFVFTSRPKLMDKLKSYGLYEAWHALPNLHMAGSVSFADMIHLRARAAASMTDSNSMQEECAVLRNPCIVTNDFIQFPELLNSMHVTGVDTEAMLNALESPRKKWPKIGDGRATARMAQAIEGLE